MIVILLSLSFSRQGKLCQLCLQNTDNKFRLTAEDDDESIADSLLLDEKQDAFLKIQVSRLLMTVFCMVYPLFL